MDQKNQSRTADLLAEVLGEDTFEMEIMEEDEEEEKGEKEKEEVEVAGIRDTSPLQGEK